MSRATSKGNESEIKDETPFRYAHAEIRTRVVVICYPTRYRLTTEAPPWEIRTLNQVLQSSIWKDHTNYHTCINKFVCFLFLMCCKCHCTLDSYIKYYIMKQLTSLYDFLVLKIKIKADKTYLLFRLFCPSFWISIKLDKRLTIVLFNVVWFFFYF